MNPFTVSSFKNKRNCMQDCIVIKETGKAKLVFAQHDQLKFWVPNEIFTKSMCENQKHELGLQLPRWFKLTLLDVNLKPIEK